MGEDTEVFGKEKKCPDCGEAVPESSSYCPYCGYDFGGGKQGPSPVGGWNKKTVAAVALLSAGVLLVGAVFLAPSVFRPYLEPLPVVGPVVGRKIPDFEIVPSTRDPLLGHPVTLDASGVEDKTRFITEYRWDFDGDGSVDTTGPEVTHQFDSTGPKEVQVKVANRQGREETVTCLLEVKAKLVREEVARAMIVWGDKEWQDTGMVIEKGDRVHIKALSGEWDPGTYVPPLGSEDKIDPCGPEGYPWKTKEIFMGLIRGRITKFPFGSLIGRIEEEPLHIGEEKGPFDSQLSGRLYLTMNDEPGAYGDNSGLVSAAIQKFSGPSEGTYPQVTIHVDSSKTKEDYIEVPVEVWSSSGLAEVRINEEKKVLKGSSEFSRKVRLYPGVGVSKITVTAVNEKGKAARSALVVDREIVEGELGTLDY